MRNKFDEQLRQLSEELMIMADMIEDAIRKAVKAFLLQDAEEARKIMNGDGLVDQEQKKIENICFQLLIQQQPVARDLRMITAAMKMVTDMERIGDQAADISELTVMMAQAPYRVNIDNLKRMAAETMTMLISAIEAFVEKDMAKARRVISHDDVVDDLFVAVKTELIEVMKTYPADEEQAADLLMVNKYLERIGDHAVNIAEWVIFSLNDTPVDQPS